VPVWLPNLSSLYLVINKISKNMMWNLVKINKTWLREIDDLYYVGDIIDIDGDGWVNREDAELVVYEYENGVRES
jgi:hypothetical protein